MRISSPTTERRQIQHLSLSLGLRPHPHVALLRPLSQHPSRCQLPLRSGVGFRFQFALDGLSGGTEPPSPVVDPPGPPQASVSASSLPNGDAIGLSPRPVSRLRPCASVSRRDRDNGQPLRPSFLPVNSQQVAKARNFHFQKIIKLVSNSQPLFELVLLLSTRI